MQETEYHLDILIVSMLISLQGILYNELDKEG